MEGCLPVVAPVASISQQLGSIGKAVIPLESLSGVIGAVHIVAVDKVLLVAVAGRRGLLLRSLLLRGLLLRGLLLRGLLLRGLLLRGRIGSGLRLRLLVVLRFLLTKWIPVGGSSVVMDLDLFVDRLGRLLRTIVGSGYGNGRWGLLGGIYPDGLFYDIDGGFDLSHDITLLVVMQVSVLVGGWDGESTDGESAGDSESCVHFVLCCCCFCCCSS